MSVTLAEIARRAAVSKMTASNVLSGRSKPTRAAAVARAAKIRRIADELGYRPNAAAQAMTSGRFGSVALVLSTRSNRSTLPQERLQGLCDALAERETSLLVTQMSDAKLGDEVELPQAIRSLCCDGLLLNYTDHIPPGLIETIERHSIPAVWINARQDHNCVHPDDFDAALVATRKLVAAGHRRIAFSQMSYGLREPSTHYSSIERRAGYEQAMREAGLQADVLAAPGTVCFTGEKRLPAAAAMLRRDARPTAVLAYGTLDATTVLAAAERIGLSVPADLSLASFGLSPITPIGVVISTMILDEAALARAAVATLFRRLGDTSKVHPSQAIPFTWSGDKTIAPPA
jgi:DNA-binding LacI/PurR family transcriptional regulator